MDNFDFLKDETKYDTFVTYGRFQPFHRAHLDMVKMLYAISLDYMRVPEIIIGVSETSGDAKNPLLLEDKIQLIKDSCPHYLREVIKIIPSKDPWKFSENFQGKNVFWICGGDQLNDYQRMANNLSETQPKLIRVVNYGNRSEFDTSPGLYGNYLSKISATLIREKSKSNDTLFLAQTLSDVLNENQIFEVMHKLNGTYSKSLTKFNKNRK